MAARWTASLVWAALAASLVFWALRLGVGVGVGAQPAPAGLQTVAPDRSARGDILRLFANPPAADAPVQQAAAASRFKLLGVIAGADDGARGWAVLSVDGKPARTIEVGGAVDGDWVVQTVARRRVDIGPAGGAAVAVLELAPPPAAATGSLPGIGAPAAAVPGLPAMAVPNLTPNLTPNVPPIPAAEVPPQPPPPPMPDAAATVR
jgi:general secretion pathway protein C